METLRVFPHSYKYMLRSSGSRRLPPSAEAIDEDVRNVAGEGREWLETSGGRRSGRILRNKSMKMLEQFI